eukprot:m.3917 g.3917  ORF g.3917 m.3917 type:complete len:183 (+) comp6610_c0_seq1:35-583(+)
MTAPTPAVVEGAQFITVFYGQDESVILNLNCSARHLCDHLANLLDIATSSQLDLASERGRLSDLTSVGDMETQATTLLKSRTCYVPVLITQALSTKQLHQFDDALSVSGGVSRPSSSRSVSSRKSSRRGTTQSGHDDSKDNFEMKTYYQVWIEGSALQAKFPAFELTQRTGTKIKKNYIKKL